MTYNWYEKFLSERNKKIYELRNEGWTFQRIADEVGLSKNRVNQIYKRIDIIIHMEKDMIVKSDAIQKKHRIVDRLIGFYAINPSTIVRAYNCIIRSCDRNKLRDALDNNYEYLYDFDIFANKVKSMTYEDFLSLRNCGKKTADFLMKVKEDIESGKLDQMQREDAGN